MKELRLMYFYKGFTIAKYYKFWDRVNDELSGYIELTKGIPEEKDKFIIQKILKGFVFWSKKYFKEKEYKFDIIIRALGHDELTINLEKPLHVFGEMLAKEIKAEFKPDLISKIKITKSQTELGYDYNSWRRQKNIIGSLKVSDDYKNMWYKNILIIDDVKTTGSTLREIAKILSANKSNKLFFLCFGENSQTPNNDLELLNLMNSEIYN